ncbi:esterase/lipase family protein [Schaalia odontolytica]|uniref:Lecithin:cholesterol acyltransferase n=1 Tax=Schaalia odontolytica TaxID=1660 RepID=A0A2X0U789_9ACTO|nr:lecithin--cholesterol acyltransferase [Schaalia odontolytica]WMS27302.1 lecithin--cholesterol acyltransferase [Schaalia odontolytica]SPT56145.1 Lecithin:cholesterol acyltransferase [Schaalia odontolytica]
MSRSLPLVVVIPGIGGSELADASGTIVYRAGLGSLLSVGRDPSALDPNNELRPVGLIGPCSLICWQFITGYDGLLSGITKGLGLSPGRVVTAGEDLVDRDATVVAFPYDFRRSVEQIANDLDRVVRERAQGRHVVLVAHSMGGLVAAWWWSFMSEGIDVDQIITLGTPFRGAAKALDVLVNGMRIGPFPATQAVSDTVRTWDSVFDLLPHYQVVSGNDNYRYPYELPSGITSAVAGFSGKARVAYEKNRCLHKALANMVAESGSNPFTVYYSQGHTTLGHASIDTHSDGLVVAKGNPRAIPASWDGGDGTVPTFSAIPDVLEDNVSHRRRLRGKHQDLVEETLVFEHVSEHARDRLPAAARGARRHDVDAYLQLDLEDVVLAGTQAEVRLRVVDKAGSVLDVGNVGGNVGGKRFRAERCDDGWWSAQLPALEEGVHSLMLSATGVPNVDRLVLKTRVGAAS